MKKWGEMTQNEKDDELYRQYNEVNFIRHINWETPAKGEEIVGEIVTKFIDEYEISGPEKIYCKAILGVAEY